MKILIADDSPSNLMLLTLALKNLGAEVIAVPSGEEAIKVFKKDRPDLIILDVSMEGMSGFECASKIRKMHLDDWIPIIFLSANISDESISQGIDAGGDDYLLKPFSKITLAAKIKAMQRISDMRKKIYDTSKQLEYLSKTDTLTGIHNRLQFNKVIFEKMRHADEKKQAIALMFLDLDNFKTINDTYGHYFGDLLLIEVSNRLVACLRKNDFIARIGGDEFAIILEHMDVCTDAKGVAQKIINSISNEYQISGYTVHTGVSIGIACYPSPNTNHETFLQNADKAMYKAKELGRNRFQFY